MIDRSFLHQLGEALFKALCGAGGAAGLFLLLCTAGVVSPDLLVPPAEKEAVQTAAPATVPADTSPPFRAASLPADALDQAGEIRGYDGVMVTMKEPDGSLHYVSSLPLAADCGVSGWDPAQNQAIRDLNHTDGIYAIARVSCLRDLALTRQNPDLALKRASGSPWRDAEGLYWLDPAQSQVQTYLIGVCRELAQLGFDEIVLTDCAYPTGAGDLPDPGSRAETLETFCRRLQGALSDFPAALSIEGKADGQGLLKDSGQTAALLASFPGRVWVRAEDQEALAVFNPVIFPQ